MTQDAPSTETANKASILVVDDVLENIQVLGSVLRKAGYEIRVGQSGEEGLKLAKMAPPDLILLDIMMPGIDGYETCRRLKKDPVTTDIPVIFLSALSSEDDELKGLDHGAVDYLTKPFSAKIVLARVARHLAVNMRHQVKTKELTPERLAALIESGESEKLEFKSTIRWNIHADKGDKNIELAWAKSVVAFMNTDGGMICIGVDDDGTILGLEADRFKSADKLMLHVNNVIEAHVGMDHAHFMHIDIIHVQEKSVLVIRCSPSERPAFLKTQDAEDMYIRVGPASRRLTTREAIEYLASRKQVQSN